MRRWLALASLLVACDGGTATPAVEPQSAAAPEPVAVHAPDVDDTEAKGELSEDDPMQSPAAEASLIVIDLDPARGSLSEQLTLLAGRAQRAGHRPIVEMRARWCPICKRVDATIGQATADPRLRGVMLLRVDTDVWADDLRSAGLVSPTIPTFYALDRRGRPVEELRGHGWTPGVDVLDRVAAFVASDDLRGRSP